MTAMCNPPAHEPSCTVDQLVEQLTPLYAAPPAHGRASVRSPSMSLLAYSAVVNALRCRSNWPISASGAPAASMLAAAVCRS